MKCALCGSAKTHERHQVRGMRIFFCKCCNSMFVSGKLDTRFTPETNFLNNRILGYVPTFLRHLLISRLRALSRFVNQVFKSKTQLINRISEDKNIFFKNVIQYNEATENNDFPIGYSINWQDLKPEIGFLLVTLTLGFVGLLSLYIYDIIPQGAFVFSIFFITSLIGLRLNLVCSAWDFVDRAIVLVLPSILVLVEFMLSAKILLLSDSLWHCARLAPIFALVKGYRLYYGSDSGPVLNTIYPPMAFLSYFPSVLANSLTAAVVIAGTVASALTFTPIFLAHVSNCRINFKGFISGLFVFICFCLIGQGSPFFGVFYFVHADAPAIGFGFFACSIVFSHHKKNGDRFLQLSAALTVLSICSKQVMITLPLGLGGYLLLCYGLNNALKYLFYTVIYLVAISAFFAFFFGFHETLFNIFTIPSQTPRTQDLLGGIAWVFSACKDFIFFPMLLLTLGCLVSISRNGFSMSVLSIFVDRNRWLVFLFAAIALMPPSAVAATRLGAAVNTVSFPVVFLLASITLSVNQLLKASNLRNDSSISIPKTLILGTLIFITILRSPSASELEKDLRSLKQLPNNPRQLEYEYEMNRPGQIYFAWNPLASLMAHGKLNHFSYGLADRDLSGFPISQKHFLEYLPSDFKLIALGEDGYVTQKYLPKYTKRVFPIDLSPKTYVVESVPFP